MRSYLVSIPCGLWGGLLAYFALAVPAVLLLSRQRRVALDLVAVLMPLPRIPDHADDYFITTNHTKPRDGSLVSVLASPYTDALRLSVPLPMLRIHSGLPIISPLLYWYGFP